MSWTEGLGSAEIQPPPPPPHTHTHTHPNLAQLRNALIDEWNNIPMRTVNALLTLSKGELGQQRQQEGGTPDIDFQFDFDFKIWGVATNELQ